MKTWVFADIHGRYDLLVKCGALITQNGFDLSDPNQELVSCGDKNDRGPDTYKVIEWFRTHHMQYPNKVHMIMGNHERMLLDAAKGTSDLMYYNGGNATLHSYVQATELYGRNNLAQMLDKVDHHQFLKNHVLYYETPDYFFSHAPQCKPQYDNGLNPGEDFKTSEQALTWTYIDGEPLEEWVNDKLIPKDNFELTGEYKLCVAGHIHGLRPATIKELVEDTTKSEYVTKHPMQIGNYILLDSGAGCHPDAVLSCLELPSKTIYDSNGRIYKL